MSPLSSFEEHKNLTISETTEDLSKQKMPFFFISKSLLNKEQLIFTS